MASFDEIKDFLADLPALPEGATVVFNFNITVGDGEQVPPPDDGGNPPPPDDGGNPPPPPPPPADLRIYRVTAEKAIGYVVGGENKKGFPIMVHPPVAERRKWLTGQEVQVLNGRVEADGEADFFEVAVVRGANGETLYLSENDGKLVG